MKNFYFKILKAFLLLIFLSFFSGCTNIVVKDLATINHKNLAGTNNFASLIDYLVWQQEINIKSKVAGETILVSDFVNLDRLKNRSKLGFLLAEHLKNSASSRGIVVREVELGKQFQYGKSGLNVLTRKQSEILNTDVQSKYALVGTYSLTTKSMIVFIKLIDLSNGDILSSGSGSTLIDEEIRELERSNRTPQVYSPMVL